MENFFRTVYVFRILNYNGKVEAGVVGRPL